MFAGVGGGLTNGQRSASIAAYAEHQGAFGLVCNTFITEEAIRAIKETVEIPLVYTVVSEQADVAGKLAAGVDFLNVSGAARTPEIVAHIREQFPEVPIIATGWADGRHYPGYHRGWGQCHHLHAAHQRRAVFREYAEIPGQVA